MRMKKSLLALAALAFVAQAYALDGAGTAENPFKITKMEDFAEMETAPAGSYYILMNDINAQGADYVGPFQGFAGNINFDGNYHVIKNFTCSNCSYGGLFGWIDGSVKNLGIEMAVISNITEWDAAGVLAAYAGCNAPVAIDNCYTTGLITCYYAGGIIGGTKAGITITNCYSATDCQSLNGFAGGIIGCAANYSEGKTITTNISNCYASGVIDGVIAGGITGGTQTYKHPATGSEVVNLKDVIAWNIAVRGTIANPFIDESSTTATINKENLNYYKFMRINDDQVKEGGLDADGLKGIVKTWSAFALVENELPVLKWQIDGGQSGINEIVVDEAAEAEYFNLQGAKVANPDNGIYIVRRGNKVTKEIIR